MTSDDAAKSNTSAFSFQQIPVELIIPEMSLALLPFLEEAPAKWSENSDVYRFLVSLFDVDGEMQEGDAVKTINYSFYGRYLYEIGSDRFRGIALDFIQRAREARAPISVEEAVGFGNPRDQALERPDVEQSSTVTSAQANLLHEGIKAQLRTAPDMWHNDHFGLMAKYAVAWNGVEHSILSEDAFFSLAHLLEASAELDCSILLASQLYYRQALQVLRGFLEHTVAQLHFCNNEQAFTAWKMDAYSMPTFRGRGGMLEQLVAKGVLTRDLADVGGQLYAALNGSIHGKASQLLFRDLPGQDKGLVFSNGRFENWCEHFARCVDFALRAIRINLVQWEQVKSGRGVICVVCHEDNDFDAYSLPFELKGVPLVQLVCRRCGNTMALPARLVDNQEAPRFSDLNGNAG